MYDKYLYPSEVKGLLGENISPQDSAQFVEAYIDHWIQQNIILRIAENNLQQELPEINRQTKEYKESLLIYAYEKFWLSQNLDTIIKTDSLEAYYNAHLQDFILQADIYKLSYAVIPVTNSKYDSLYFWFNKDIEKYRNELESFCLVNCSNYLFESQQWMFAESLIGILPAEMYANENLRNTKTLTGEDATNRYLVKTHAFMKAGEQAPFEFVQEDIRRIMINQKKIALLKRNYQKIVTESLRINDAEIYKYE